MVINYGYYGYPLWLLWLYNTPQEENCSEDGLGLKVREEKIALINGYA